MAMSDFECCFCRKEIEANAVDPIDIKVVLNNDFKHKTGAFQLFYAHFDCFKQKLHKDLQGYLINGEA